MAQTKYLESQERGPEERPSQEGRSYGVLAECIGYNLRISYSRASQCFAQVFEDQELAPIQFAALEFIANNPNLSQRQIAESISTTPTVLVKPLERLENRGLISRLRSTADRRRSRIRLTPSGEEILKEARQRILGVEERLTSGLTEQERKTLLELLAKITRPGR